MTQEDRERWGKAHPHSRGCPDGIPNPYWRGGNAVNSKVTAETLKRLVASGYQDGRIR